MNSKNSGSLSYLGKLNNNYTGGNNSSQTRSGTARNGAYNN